MSSRRSPLPQAAADALDGVGERIAAGLPAAREVESALRALDALPPHLIGAVRSEIALRCRFGIEPRRLLPVPDFLARALPGLFLPSQQNLLGRCEGLEYLFLFHPSGLLREAALERIGGGARSPFFFGAVAYRLNDWAWQVRAAAARCALRTFPATAPQVVAGAAISLLGRLDTWSRWSDEARLLDEAFDRADVVDSLAERLRTERTGPMPRVLVQALRRPAIDRHLLRLARESAIPGVRAVALGALVEARAAWPAGFETRWIDKSSGLSRRVRRFDARPVERPAELDALVAIGAADKAAAVRRVAAQALVRHRDSLRGADRLIQGFLRDSSPSIRERAEFVLRTRRPE